MPQIHVLACQKGGVGKTTLAVNLAAVAHDVLAHGAEDSPILVVSTDPQGSAVWWADRVDTLPFDFTQAHEDPEILRKLKDLEQYQHIFVDTPGSLEDEHILSAALDVADDVLVPLITEAMCFDPAARTIEYVIKPRNLPFRAVINAWDPRDGKTDLEATQRFIERQGWPRANVVIRRYKVHARAAAVGQVVTQYDPSRTTAEARQDFYRLALECGYGGGAAS